MNLGLFNTTSPKVYMKSSEMMSEVPDGSVDFLIYPGVFLGKDVHQDEYMRLIDNVFVKEGRRVLADTGIMMSIYTNGYELNGVADRHTLCRALFARSGYFLADEKIWVRRSADFFQIPFSYVSVFQKNQTTYSLRTRLNKNKDYFQGVWTYKQSKSGECNSWPDDMCEMMIRTFTNPGQTILDPFCGRGRLLGIASGMGRTAIGYDINEKLIPILEKNGCEVIR